MIYLEMSRVETHGGGTWAFPNCIWSPSRKENGSKWPFWEKVLAVNEGDTIIHLRGVQPKANFVGFSRVAGNGFTTTKRPPETGAWSFASTFYRADLTDYTPFHTPINLTTVFSEQNAELTHYFEKNKSSIDRKNIFFVRQSNRLQCLNGAYLSDVDEELLSALFDLSSIELKTQEKKVVVSVETSIQLKSVKTRLGQSEFSKKIKNIYKNKCCFPSCEINDPRFLVGAHIARWSDNEHLRGHLGNGLCLCVFHDKAFELGLFTLDAEHRIFLNPREEKSNSAAINYLLPHRGKKITLSEVTPLDDAVIEHWIRCDLSP